ncbi:hypothetical protein GCM10008018_69100 [Paenibacillus marchantiophytorum]|uniref:Uncharacterized protein n=1 Tax=Paenibacillus marchantiophytorum TaxID=1619310 RepID=A0ABQ1FHP0_9BACL|nr:hypothetical protein [Paenibacillus marchantiophytorum]GGA14365.1 hypothetical protein GCM10008018_69100 [Paenibacillus marchantiophytorum]
MSISFTSSIIDRLKKEIADDQQKSSEEQKKKAKVLSKINQLQRDLKLSNSASDLNSKMSRMNKMKEEIKRIDLSQAALSKQLAKNQAALQTQIAKDQQQETTN